MVKKHGLFGIGITTFCLIIFSACTNPAGGPGTEGDSSGGTAVWEDQPSSTENIFVTGEDPDALNQGSNKDNEPPPPPPGDGDGDLNIPVQKIPFGKNGVNADMKLIPNPSAFTNLVSQPQVITASQYCQDKYDTCFNQATTIAEKGDCADEHEKCIEPYNCSTQKGVCLANNNPSSDCYHEFERCPFVNQCREGKQECIQVNQAVGECNAFFDSCKNAIDGKIAQCKDGKSECIAIGNGVGECTAFYDDCMRGL